MITKTAEDARSIIATMERETKSMKARKALAAAAAERGNYDEAGRQVFRDWLARQG